MRTIKDVKWTKQDKQVLSKYQLSGFNTINKASDQLGYDVADLKAYVNKDFKTLIGKNRKPTKQEKLAMMQDYLDGFVDRQADAAKIIGISHSTLKGWLKEIGYSSKDQRYINRKLAKPVIDNERIKSHFPMLTKAWI